MLNLIVLSVRHRMEDDYRLLGVYENKGMVAHAVNVFLGEKQKAGMSSTEYDFSDCTRLKRRYASFRQVRRDARHISSAASCGLASLCALLKEEECELNRNLELP